MEKNMKYLYQREKQLEKEVNELLKHAFDKGARSILREKQAALNEIKMAIRNNEHEEE